MDSLKPIVAGCKAMIIRDVEHPENLWKFIDVIERADPGMLCVNGTYTGDNGWLVKIPDTGSKYTWYCEEGDMVRIDLDDDQKEEAEEDFEIMMVEAFLKVATAL